MADVALQFKFTESGSTKVQKALADAANNTTKLGNNFNTAARQAKTLQQRMEEFSRSNLSVMLVGQAALELTNKLTAAAKAAYAFAKAGAATSGVAEEFRQLDEAIEQSKLRMQESAARFLVNSGAMEGAGDAADNLSNVFNVLENTLSALGPVVDLIGVTMKALNAPVTALSAGIDYLSETFSLSAESGEQFAESFQRISDIMASAQIEQGFKDLASSIKESFSDDATAEQIEAIAATLTNMTKAGVSASDVQVILGEQILAVSGSLRDYEANILRVVDAVKAEKDESIQAKATSYQAASALDVLAAAAKNTAFEFGRTKAPMVDFNRIGNEIAGTLLSGSGALGEWLGGIKTNTHAVRGHNRELEVQLDLTHQLAALRNFGIENEIPQRIAILEQQDKELKGVEALYAAEAAKLELTIEASNVELDAINKKIALDEKISKIRRDGARMEAAEQKTQKQLVLDTAQTFGSMTAEYLGGGWARAGFEAAFQTGMGIAELALPPLFGANRFAAAAQLLLAQAFAGSNGGSGKSGGGSAGAAGGGGMAASRPPSELDRGGRGQPTSIVLNVDGRRLGEEASRGMNQAGRSGTARLDPSVLGSAGWRDRI